MVLGISCISTALVRTKPKLLSLQHTLQTSEKLIMDIGVFIPIGNNGWLISKDSPQYKPTFDLNKEIVIKAEEYGLDFALSMIKLRGFGGDTEFWDYNLESFTLMAGLAAEHGEKKTVMIPSHRNCV